MQPTEPYRTAFVGALRNLASLSPEYAATRPDFVQISQILARNREPELMDTYLQVKSRLLQPFAEYYVKTHPARGGVANACHAVSAGFRESWGNLEVAAAFPLTVTIGNVYFRGDNIYKVTFPRLTEILRLGPQAGQTLDVHVWLTCDNLEVIDLTIKSTLLRRRKLNPKKVKSPVLFWSEDEPGDFSYEPLLIDNDFFAKVDTGLFYR
jgi:hypothetical protein